MFYIILLILVRYLEFIKFFCAVFLVFCDALLDSK